MTAAWLELKKPVELNLSNIVPKAQNDDGKITQKGLNQ